MREPLKTGTQVGRYELLLPAARGGMAEVWAARLHGTRGFQKLVAVKALREDLNERARLESMFFEEAKLASKIRHPNVVETFELGEADGSMYLVMEWVDGESLRQIQKQNNDQPLPIPIAVHLIAQCCKGLHAAHELDDDAGRPLGLVHRDVSPHNIMVTYSGIAKLTDFGVAKVNSDSDQELTAAGEVKGKVPYMAPEYLAGKSVDRRADLFALGLVLYELTTGHHPFRGETAVQTVRNLSGAEAEPPRKFIPGFPMALSAVLRKAVRLKPEARFATAMDFLAMLQQAVPEAFSRQTEQQTITYLDGLLRERAAARHSALQVALATPSASSLRADQLVVSPSAQSGTIGAVTTDDRIHEATTLLPKSRRSGAARHVLLGAAMALGGVALLGSALSGSEAPGAAASGGPSGVDRGEILNVPEVSPASAPGDAVSGQASDSESAGSAQAGSSVAASDHPAVRLAEPGEGADSEATSSKQAKTASSKAVADDKTKKPAGKRVRRLRRLASEQAIFGSRE